MRSQAETETAVKDISKFVVWLARRVADDQMPLMDPSELEGELFYEIAKGLDHYCDLSGGELLAVLRKMCDNRVSELIHKYYGTHRAAIKLQISYECVVESEDDGMPNFASGADWEPDTYSLLMSAMRVNETRKRLSLDARCVFDAVVYGSESLTIQVLLSGMRKTHVYKNGKVKVRPRHVAEALAIDISRVKAAFCEIRERYKEVMEEYG